MGISWSNNNTTIKYGWKPDLPDKRDFYHNFYADLRTSIPNKVDLRSNCPEIYNQGKLGSCTANAIAAAYEFDEKKQENNELCPNDRFIPSRLFIYYNERAIEHTINTDLGANIRDGVKSINTDGVCSEKEWPYDIQKFKDKPPKQCYEMASSHKSVSYKRVPQTISSMKACLNRGLPFIFGFSVYESFESNELSETGIMSMPTQNETILGGHAVMAVGYCENRKCFIIRNSWGKEWGEDGYFYMPYIFIKDKDYASDFWTIQKVVNSDDDIISDLTTTKIDIPIDNDNSYDNIIDIKTKLD